MGYQQATSKAVPIDMEMDHWSRQLGAVPWSGVYISLSSYCKSSILVTIPKISKEHSSAYCVLVFSSMRESSASLCHHSVENIGQMRREIAIWSHVCKAVFIHLYTYVCVVWVGMIQSSKGLRFSGRQASDWLPVDLPSIAIESLDFLPSHKSAA